MRLEASPVLGLDALRVKVREPFFSDDCFSHLVFTVYNTFSVAVPALPAAQALVALFRRRACHLIVIS